jgi:SEC-C motif
MWFRIPNNAFVQPARSLPLEFSASKSETKFQWRCAMSRILKVGRNDPCPCGSGLKFKKCHLGKLGKVVPAIDAKPATRSTPVFGGLRIAPPELRDKAMRIFQEQNRREKERVARFGQIRPQISMLWNGNRFVAVRNRLYHSDKWKFFPDFLRDYVPYVFGIEWCKVESAKPEAERHPVIQWRTQGAVYMNAQPAQPDGSRVAHPSGALKAYTCFAYDLFVVADNSELDDRLIQRLKNRDQFQGARHELFAEATCLRGGFAIQHENEKDGSVRHAEFTAKHEATGQLLSVEAKSRHREGVMGRPGKPDPKPDLRFGPLINDAIEKNPPHPLVIFLDTNLPFRWAERLYAQKVGNVCSGEMHLLLERIKKDHNNVDPYCMMVFSNLPYHYAPDDLAPEKHLFSVVSQPPRADLNALQNLHTAANLYGNIPNGFSPEEGEPPPPVVPVSLPKVRYDFQVNGTIINVIREGQPTNLAFSTRDKDRPQASSPLHEFLESIGFSRVDSHPICVTIEGGNSVQGVIGSK